MQNAYSRIKQRIEDKAQEAESIMDKAAEEDRELTEAEQSRVDALVEQIGVRGNGNKPSTGLFKQLEAAEVVQQSNTTPVQLGKLVEPDLGQKFTDLKSGKAVYALSNKQSVAKLINREYRGDNDPDMSLGRMIQCAITGRWNSAPAELRNAMSEGSNSGGGFLVPSRLSSSVIDKARAWSVAVRAGAITIPMDSETLTMARVETDPTFEVKSENAAFSGTDVAFDAINFNAHTIGNYITASRELAEDAPNFAQQIEDVLARSLAAELDRQVLQGDDSQEMLGVINDDNVGETTSVGAIAWEDLATAVVSLWSNNIQPNAYVISPTIAGDLHGLTSGDGTNSAKLWLKAPPTVEPLEQFITSNCPDANIVVGDFTNLAVAIRTEPLVEISTTAGDFFSKHQVGIKITWRGDTNRLRSSAFHVLKGITT